MRCWRRVTFSVPETLTDRLFSILHDAGTLGAESGDDSLVSWFPESMDPDRLLAAIRTSMGRDAGRIRIVADEVVPDERWHERWMASLAPRALGRRFLVIPGRDEPVAEPAAGRLRLRIAPGRAFGTGEHITTRLCLELLEEIVKPDTSLLDVGTGSGILAIAGRLLGARPVFAVDHDVEAVSIARRNATLSGAPTIRFAAAGIDSLRPRVSDRVAVRPVATVVANIDTPTLLRGMPALSARAGRDLVVSGLLEEDAPAVRSAGERAGFRVAATRLEEGWGAVHLVRDR